MNRKFEPMLRPAEKAAWRPGDFASLAEALDYAARGRHGITFFDGRGEISAEISYLELRRAARQTARRLLALNVSKGDRIALVAETRPEFAVLFFACQYAGLVPVPMPATINLGGHSYFVRQLEFLIENSESRAAFATAEFIGLVREAAATLDLEFVGTLEELTVRPMNPAPLEPASPADVAYVQYTSGSTRVARGAVISQHAVMCNLEAIIRDGLRLGPDDRYFSWLPFYHDMGLVGMLLAPVAGQLPAAYLEAREFAKRPRLWLRLIERTKSTISFGPPFGYELCARRLRPGDGSRFRLESWRIAGVGAEIVRPETLETFARALAGSGFDRRAFLPCYGMAEVGVAISCSDLGRGVLVERVDRDQCIAQGWAQPIERQHADSGPVCAFVDCGPPLPGSEVEIRDPHGQRLEDRSIGVIWVKTDSVMEGYLNEPRATAEVLSGDGWINTGDVGFLVGGHLFVTGREKDIIIVKGRNVWPQDLEYLAELQPGVRTGDAMAFSFPDVDGSEQVVMLIQCRERDEALRQRLRHTVEAQILAEFGFHCKVELVAAHTLPRTSSGKPSRSSARRNYATSLARQSQSDAALA